MYLYGICGGVTVLADGSRCKQLQVGLVPARAHSAVTNCHEPDRVCRYPMHIGEALCTNRRALANENPTWHAYSAP